MNEFAYMDLWRQCSNQDPAIMTRDLEEIMFLFQRVVRRWFNNHPVADTCWQKLSGGWAVVDTATGDVRFDVWRIADTCVELANRLGLEWVTYGLAEGFMTQITAHEYRHLMPANLRINKRSNYSDHDYHDQHDSLAWEIDADEYGFAAVIDWLRD